MNKLKKDLYLSKFFKIILTFSLIWVNFGVNLSEVRSESTQEQSEENIDFGVDDQPENRAGGSSYVYNFDEDGRPGHREGGASRGNCPPTNLNLMALVPKTNLGLTVDEYPTFWFYIPYQSSSVPQAELMVLDENRRPILEKQILIQLSGIPGIISVKLPSTAKSLELNQEYRWYFSLICDAENPSNNPSIDGWIKRVELNAASNNYQAYVNNGIWYNALTEVAKGRQTNPSDTAIATEWQKLLQAVGLEELTETSVIDCCITN